MKKEYTIECNGNAYSITVNEAWICQGEKMTTYEALKQLNKEDFERVFGQLLWIHSNTLCQSVMDGITDVVKVFADSAKTHLCSKEMCMQVAKEILNKENLVEGNQEEKR